MASSTVSRRPGNSSCSGMQNGIAASRILLLARTSRLPMAVGDMRNADAMVAASSPRMTCRIKGARIAASMAGCAQANIRASRRSGISAGSASSWASTTAAICSRSSSTRSLLCCRRAESMSLRRATVSSHASGLAGTAFAWPVCQRRCEGLGEGILCGGYVMCACGKKGDELAVAAAGDCFRRAACLLLAFA